jgi:hypothetical protein
MNDTLLTEIIAAFQSQNLRPIRRIFFLHDEGGDFTCPLVAVLLHRELVDRSDPDVAVDGGANAALEYDLGVAAAQHLQPRDPAI